MIVKEGREYIVNNGLKDIDNSNISIYFGTNENITTENMIFDTADNQKKVNISDSTKYKYTKDIEINKNNLLDITFNINDVNPTNLGSENELKISSMLLVINDETLLSRVVFPTRTLNGNTTALNFEYHLYF